MLDHQLTKQRLQELWEASMLFYSVICDQSFEHSPARTMASDIEVQISELADFLKIKLEE